jgi:hypothetical protein
LLGLADRRLTTILQQANSFALDGQATLGTIKTLVFNWPGVLEQLVELLTQALDVGVHDGRILGLISYHTDYSRAI